MIRSLGAEDYVKEMHEEIRLELGDSLFCSPLMPLLSQEAPRAATKPELTVVQIKVTDKKTGSAIDNADVRVKWGQQESDSSSATTNSKGIAKLTDVPRGIAVIRVIANGYDVAAPR